MVKKQNSVLTKSLEDGFYDAFNEGRENEASIQGLNFGVVSAMMDDNVCDFCNWADGRYFISGESHNLPPFHFGCRCIVAYFNEGVLDEEVDQVFMPWESPPVETFPPGSKKGKG